MVPQSPQSGFRAVRNFLFFFPNFVQTEAYIITYFFLGKLCAWLDKIVWASIVHKLDWLFLAPFIFFPLFSLGDFTCIKSHCHDGAFLNVTNKTIAVFHKMGHPNMKNLTSIRCFYSKHIPVIGLGMYKPLLTSPSLDKWSNFCSFYK